jgi:hypothetical protein
MLPERRQISLSAEYPTEFLAVYLKKYFLPVVIELPVLVKLISRVSVMAKAFT